MKRKVLNIGKGWHEMGPIRPPNEGRDCSLLLRVTRGCAWNRCEFCRTYKSQPYSQRPVDEIKEDIDTVKKLAEELKVMSWRLGFKGDMSQELIFAFVNDNPDLYINGESDVIQRRLASLTSVAAWLAAGARTVFLQDGNAVEMKTSRLLEILHYLRESFPGVERITSYARSKTVAKKPLEDLERLHEAGLSRLHIGFESGCDEVLAFMKKGTTAEEHIMAGKKAKAAGISLSEYYMPGLGGKKWSKEHALESAEVLNEIKPDFIRLRSLVLRQGSPLSARIQAGEGEFEPLIEDEVVEEIALFLEHLDCSAYVTSDQMCNLLWEVEGQLPRDKEKMLKIIDDYLQMPLHQRLEFQLERRVSSYRAIAGHLDKNLAADVKAAREALGEKSTDAFEKVQKVLNTVKPAFV
ncbi:radical SAM protein [Calderihabitans maritimus]|uniref:Radical SAM domain-containing protein n=1 Tax=Calderihabitans maritimus TaxID=1246530 RepID=A0A1Z5HVE1_9FIRM|nr:radical SAM protein [Calderihabitans maritimus]GAW93506.1 Radical SAM domain-containing protein [Calderihabitans maritimus]